MLLCLLFLAAFYLNWALKASCNMRLHNDGTEIGKVVLTDDRKNKTSIRANLKGDPEIIKQGLHGFHIHEKPVEGNNCGPESTGGHYNPFNNTHGELHSPSDSRHVGDFGNVQAGERGEVNFYVEIDSDMENIKTFENVGGSMLGREDINCGPWHHDPECYVPMKESWVLSLHTHRFKLEGNQSVVGRAVVLHAGRDDLGRGVDEGSFKTGNAGSRIACCTLKLDE